LKKNNNGEVFEPTTEYYLEIMYMMQIYTSQINKLQQMGMFEKKDPHNIKIKSEIEKTKSNCNSLGKALNQEQNKIHEYLMEKYDFVIQ
jgi:hypothetical protein